MATHGDPNSTDENLLLGSDFRYRTTRFMSKYTLEANLYAMGTHTDGPDYDGGLEPVLAANVSLPNDLFEVEAGYLEIAREFNPALGFAPRRAVRRYSSALAYQPRPESISWLRQYFAIYEAAYFTDLSNELESALNTITPLRIQFESSDEVFLQIEHEFDGPGEPFEIIDGTTIASGDYWWTRGKAGFETAPRRMLSLRYDYSFGGFYDGHRQEHAARLTFLPSKHFGLETDYSINFIDLPVGKFQTQLVSLTALVNFTPDLTWSNLAQYDNISDSLGINSRLIWEYRPGSKLFLVLNQSYLDERTGLVLKQTEATLKAGAILRF